MSKHKKLPQLIAEKRGRMPLHQTAREAGVAFRTLKAVIDDTFGKEAGGNEENPHYVDLPRNEMTSQAIRGYVVSLCRVAKYVDASIDDVLREYDFDPEAQVVKNAVATLTPPLEGVPLATTGPLSEDGVTVRAGLLTWSPVIPSETNSAEDESFGGKYVTSLLTALNPALDIRFRFEDVVGVGINSLCSEPPDLDLLVGVCDTAYRRLRGIHFINLPGLGIPISGLACGTTEFSWEDFVGLQDQSRLHSGTKKSFVTVKDEVGDLFIRGHVSLKKYEKVTCAELDARELSITLLKRAYHLNEIPILVADAFTVNKTQKDIRSVLVSDESLRSLSAAAGIPEKETRDFAKRICRIRSSEWPLYPLSIAFGRRLEKWGEVLEKCQSDEFFGNRVALAAKLYLELFDHDECIEPLPLTNQLSESQARRFCRVLEDLANQRILNQYKIRPWESADHSSVRITQFINAWQPADRIPARSPIAPSDFLAALQDIEKRILTAEPPFGPGTSLSVSHLARSLAGKDGNPATLSQLDWARAVEALDEICKFWILPALHSVGLIEETENRAEDSNFRKLSDSTWSFHNHYAIPQLARTSGPADRWMYWERYHCEVTFACLVASSPSKRSCLDELNRILDASQTTGDPMDPDSYWQFSKYDRQFHLTICRFGSPEGRPTVSVRNLERAYNRLNAALATTNHSLRQTRKNRVIREHLEIFKAIEQSGGLPVVEDYRAILSAYSQHFFNFNRANSRTEGFEDADAYLDLGIDRDFLTKLESSVLREVSALEAIAPERFFENATCHILRTNGLIPYEWEDRCSRTVHESIAYAVHQGCMFHYVSCSSDSASVSFGNAFERFRKRIQTMLPDPKLSHLVQDQILWINAAPNAHSFLKILQMDQAEGLILYGGDGVRSSQLTIRRRSCTGEDGSIRRQIEKVESDRQQFLDEYRAFLRQIISKQGPFASEAEHALKSRID